MRADPIAGIPSISTPVIQNSVREAPAESTPRRDSTQPIISPPLTVTQVPAEILARINLPQVTDEDRELLLQCAFVLTPEAAFERLEGRVITYWRESIEEYNGWEGWGHSSRSGVFFHALKGLLGTEGYEALLSKIFNQINPETGKSNLYSVMTILSNEQVGQYLAMSEDDFIFVLSETVKETYVLPIGTKPLIDAWAKLVDLEAIALARGISVNAFYYNDYILKYPGLSNEDCQVLYDLQNIANSPERIDDQLNVEKFQSTVESIIERYLGVDEPSELKESLAGALFLLYSIAPKFGVEPEDIYYRLFDKAENMGVSLEPEGRIESVSDVSGQPISVNPENLPDEVKQILMDTGYWDMVKNSIREIQFTREIDEGQGLVFMQAGGDANPALHLVRIDTERYGTIASNWEVAMTLVHEASHIIWAQTAPLQLLLTTPNERMAFLEEAVFLERYLELGSANGSLDSEEAYKVAYEYARARYAVNAANYAMGFSIDYFGQSEVPSEDFIDSLGLQSSNELDLDHYPTDLTYAVFYKPELFGFQANQGEFLTWLIQTSGIPGEIEAQLYPILMQILNEGARIEMGTDENSDLPDRIYLLRRDDSRDNLEYLGEEGLRALFSLLVGISIEPGNQNNDTLSWLLNTVSENTYTLDTVKVLEGLTSLLISLDSIRLLEQYQAASH